MGDCVDIGEFHAHAGMIAILVNPYYFSSREESVIADGDRELQLDFRAYVKWRARFNENAAGRDVSGLSAPITDKVTERNTGNRAVINLDFTFNPLEFP